MDDILAFGGVRVLVRRRELWVDGQRAAIGGRAMDVLLALVERPGELVSKDDLIAKVWGGAAIEDGAIAAQIAAVRRALGGDGGRFVQTVSGRGYRFVAVPEAPPGNFGLEVAERPSVVRRRLPSRSAAVILAALAGLAMAAMTAVLWWRDLPSWRIDRMETIADSPVIETDPAPSPSGTMVAYAAGPDRDHRRIFVKGLADGAALAFSVGAADESAPAWSRDGARLAFVRAREGQPCAILVQPFPAGREREVGRCVSSWRTTLAWSKAGDSLYFFDRVPAGAAMRIRRLDLASGAMADITRPPPQSDGDGDPAISPNGRMLAFQRATPLQSVCVVRDLASGVERTLTPPELNIAGATWADDRALLVATLEPAPSALWIYPIDGGRHRRLTLSPVEFRRVVSNGAGLVGFESQSLRHDLAYATRSPSAEAEVIASGLGAINGIDFSSTGAMAFAQSRDALSSWDVWVKQRGRPAERVTDLSADYIESPTWSPDGRRIAFQANLGHASGIYVASPDGAGLRRLTTRVADYGGATWSPDGKRLVYLEFERGVWQLWQVEVDGAGRERPFDTDGWAGVRSIGSDLLALRQAQGGVWRLGPRPQLIAADVSVRHSLDWGVGRGQIAYIDRTQPGPPRLVVRPLAGGGDRVFWAPRPMTIDWIANEGVFGGVGLDPLSDRPVYVRDSASEARAGVMRLSRR